jgi:squalene-hopene/tetraprenyl-beta-curcumene cyclase
MPFIFRLLALGFILLNFSGPAQSSELADRLRKSKSPELRSILLENMMERQRIEKFSKLHKLANFQRTEELKLSFSSDTLELGFSKTKNLLTRLASEKGYWDGRSLGSVTDSADYLLLCNYLDWQAPDRIAGMRAFLIQAQNSDGSWDLSPGNSRGRFDATAHVRLALEISGLPATSPSLVKSQDYLDSRGSLSNLRTLTRLWYCIHKRLPWKSFPPFPKALISLSFVRKFNQNHVSAWMRFAFYAVGVVIDKHRRLESEQAPPSFLRGLRKLLRKVFSRMDQKAHKIIEAYLLKQQAKNGNFFGTASHSFFGLMALHDLGYDNDSEPIRKGMAFVEGLQVKEGHTLVQDPYRGPIWDTAFTLNAFSNTELDPDHPMISKARKFLLDHQILDVYGEWAERKDPVPPGGWAFELENDLYPDNDDTAMAIIAIMQNKSPHDAKRAEKALARGIQWLQFMQNKNGSWSAWDRNQATKKPGAFRIPQSGFLKDSIANDFGTADLTGHVLEAFGSVGYPVSNPIVARAIDYLRKEQMSFGGFWGRWGVNYIYGTHAALMGLEAVGLPRHDPLIQKALTWLKSVQNKDGGFGETLESYWSQNWAGKGPSSATQTGWALMGLMAYLGPEDESVQNGIDYLLKTQRQDGGWDENVYVGAGMPPILYSYEYSPFYMPFAALAEFRQKLRVHRLSF